MDTHCNCGAEIPIKVCESGAGWYIGQFCPNCGPYSRLSMEYYSVKADAESDLSDGIWTPRLNI